MIKVLYNNTGVKIGKTVVRPTNGTPQGSVISPLAFNLYINQLLTWLESKGYVHKNKRTMKPLRKNAKVQ